MRLWCMGLPEMVAEFHSPLPTGEMYIGRLTLTASQPDDIRLTYIDRCLDKQAKNCHKRKPIA